MKRKGKCINCGKMFPFKKLDYFPPNEKPKAKGQKYICLGCYVRGGKL